MIESLPLLQKSNEMMQRLLGRTSIREVLEEQSEFFIAHSGAAMIAIFIKQEGDYVEFVFEKNKTLSSLMKRYNLHQKSSDIAQALSNALSGYIPQRPFRRVDALCPVLKGVIADKSCRSFADDSAFREAYLFPVQLQTGKQIGVISYYFTNTSGQTGPLELQKLTETFESAITPLYDEETGAFYSRYIHVDDVMPKLTQKEREIVGKVLEGETYPTIAEAMGVSINTLKTHMKNIFAKYGVSSKLELQGKIIKK